MDPRIADGLELAARKVGADPAQWRVSYHDVPIAKILGIEASVDGTAWTVVGQPSASGFACDPAFVTQITEALSSAGDARATAQMTPFEPVDIGTVGRRAVAWFLANNLVVSATDADVAGHAIKVVLEALKATRRPIDRRWHTWSLDVVKSLPAFPDEACTQHEHERGNSDDDPNQEGIGYGYVMPVGVGHEAGGALFGPGHGIRLIERHTVWLVAPGKDGAS